MQKENLQTDKKRTQIKQTNVCACEMKSEQLLKNH